METENTSKPNLLDQTRDRLRVLELHGRNQPEIELARICIKILENGGMATLPRLIDRRGNDSGAILLRGKYGPVWKTVRGEWVKDHPTAIRKEGLEKKLVKAPAWARLKKDGRVEIYHSSRNMLEVEITESRLASLG